MKNRVAPLLAIGCALGLGACSSDDSSSDLPEGWAGAGRVKTLVQEECPGSDMDFADEGASFTGGAGNIGVVYKQAHFRCEQKVEGFWKAAGDAVDMLVQPIDMHPSSVAKCDCGYNITFLVEPVSSGPHIASLYRRWDAINNPNDPVLIASALVNGQ